MKKKWKQKILKTDLGTQRRVSKNFDSFEKENFDSFGKEIIEDTVLDIGFGPASVPNSGLNKA
jgi:hypothetical protein